MPSPAARPAYHHWLAKTLLVAAAYVLTARLGLLMPLAHNSHITLLWLPSGVAVAALWRWGDRMALGVALGTLATLMTGRDPPLAHLPLVLGNVAAPFITVVLMRRFGFAATLDARRHVPILLGATMAGMLVSATIGVATLSASGVLPGPRLPFAWLRWWMGDVVGVLLAVPPLLLLSARAMRVHSSGLATLEWALIFGITLVSGASVMLSAMPGLDVASWRFGPWVFVPLLPLAWLAVRATHLFYPSLAVLALAALAAFGTSNGLGPFGQIADAQTALGILWGYLVPLDLLVLLLGTQAAELARAADRMRGLFTSSRDAILVGRPDGTVLAANPAALAMFGQSEAELRRLGRQGLMDTHDQRLPVMLAQRAAQGSALSVLRARRADGQWLDVELQTSLHIGTNGHTYTYNMMRDVSERERAAQCLRDSEERLHRALEGGKVGLWTWDVTSGEIHWDEFSCAMLGLQPGTPVGAAEARAGIHPEDVDRVFACAEQAVRHRQPYECEYRIRLADGSYRWVLGNGRVMGTAPGQRLTLSGTLIDISERRRAAEALVQAEAAERANRSKSEFVSRMSHELRTPLNAVIGFAQLLKRDIGHADADALRGQAGHIEQAGWHLLAMVDDVLDLSRMETGQMAIHCSAVPLRPALAETLPLVQGAAKARGIAVHLAPVPAQAQVLADPLRLRQVLSNLLSNAIKYNRDGGWVRLAASRRGPPAPADADTGAGAPPPAVWCLEVSDSGLGMSEQQQAHLFEPFNRLGREAGVAQGTGIGLVITRNLVQGMGGQLRVYSTPGQGSRFVVELAEASPTAAAAEPAPMAAVAPSATGPEYLPLPQTAPGAVLPWPKVLCVEDNPINALVLEAVLANEPLQLRITDTATAALALARAWQPDLILTDLSLPDESGLVLRRRLLDDPALCQVPCIAVTAQVTLDDRAAAEGLGFCAYVAKPFDQQSLLDAVHAALRQRAVPTSTQAGPPDVPAQPLAAAA